VIGADTNVLVRLVTADDEAQASAAVALLEAQGLFVTLLALMETEWVLRSAHRYSRGETTGALQALLALDGIDVEDRDFVLWAIERHSRGADFGDMLLLIAARPCDQFATFDQRLHRQAGPQSPVQIVTLP
jgi:predicted nucleic-acid-binding protein